MTSEAPVTIGICCHREGDWLRECWESVLAQDDDRWEALLVMDADADQRTREMFEELEHPKLRKFASAEKLGHGGTRNKAFELTETPYHLYLDADDKLMSYSVRCFLEGFERCPDAAAVFGDIQFFGDYDEVLRYPHDPTWDEIARLNSLPGGGAAYRMDVWRELGGLARELWPSGSDYDFNIGLAEAGHKRFHVGRVVYQYRKYRRSNSEAHAYRSWEKHEIMIARHPRFFANADRTRDFLTHAYEYSFRTLYEADDLVGARDVARRALAKGCAGERFWNMWLLAKLPLPVFRGVVPLWRLRRRLRTKARAVGAR